MVTEPAVKVRCSQLHGCASCREPSLPRCSAHQCHSHAWFKISRYFLSATVMPHYQLYIAPLPHLHFVFWTFPGASLRLCSPFLAQNCLWPSQSRAGGELPFSGEGFPDYCKGPKFYHCAQAHPQKALGSLGTSPVINLCPVTNCEGLEDFFCP